MTTLICNRGLHCAFRAQGARSSYRSIISPSAILLRRPFRSLAPQHKDDTRAQTVQQTAGQKPLVQEGTVKPESVQKSKPGAPAGQDPLLSEQTVSNKEQRKADWAIIKEMSQYLWPKVTL